MKVLKVLALLLVLPALIFASPADKKKKRAAATNVITRSDTREAEQRLSDLGYWTGPVDGVLDTASREALIAFQKLEGRTVTGKLTKDDLEALRTANRPQARDGGYKHVEVDIDRQILMFVDDDGQVSKVLPVSTGSGRYFSENGMKGTAYTPRGRFRVYAKASGWKKSPLGLLYYPNYFSDGIAIHGNPSVPTEPESHGCVRIPMFASVQMSKMMPVGTIVLVYTKDSFVSAKNWAEADQSKQLAVTAEK